METNKEKWDAALLKAIKGGVTDVKVLYPAHRVAHLEMTFLLNDEEAFENASELLKLLRAEAREAIKSERKIHELLRHERESREVKV